MKPAIVNFNKRLNKLDSTYFSKSYFEDDRVISTEKDLIPTLATYLFDSDTQIDDVGWKNIMEIRKQFPEVWWDVLDALFNGHHDT